MEKGDFIVIEGIDGVGKTSVIEALQEQQKDILCIKSLSDSYYAQEAKKMLQSPTKFNSTLFMNLCLLDIQHLTKNVVEPALERGTTVVCDRWYYSTYAYYVGFSRNKAQSMRIIRKFIHLLDLTIPDYTILVDCPLEIAMKRIGKRKSPDAIERKTKKLAEVQKIYHILTLDASMWIYRSDTLSTEEIVDQISSQLLSKNTHSSSESITPA